VFQYSGYVMAGLTSAHSLTSAGDLVNARFCVRVCLSLIVLRLIIILFRG
jgi:hypothetical protein